MPTETKCLFFFITKLANIEPDDETRRWQDGKGGTFILGGGGVTDTSLLCFVHT